MIESFPFRANELFPQGMRHDGIVVTTNVPGKEHTLADARANMEAIKQVSGGVRRPLCVDGTNASISPEAKKYYASEDAARHVTAAAIVANGMLGRVVANLVIPHTKQAMPMKLFATEDEAVVWLRDHR